MWKSNAKFWHCRESNHWMSEWNMCFNCTLQCLSNYLSHSEHTSSSVKVKNDHRSKFSNLSNCLNWKIYCDGHSSLWSTTAVQIYELFHIYFTSSSSVPTIAWKDSVKTTLAWYLTRLRVLARLCRKEITTALVHVWLMKGIFTLNPSAAKDFLPFTFPWQGLFNPSAGFVIPKWSSFNSLRDLSFAKWLEMALIKVNLYPHRRRSQNIALIFNFEAPFETFHMAGLTHTSKAVAYILKK